MYNAALVLIGFSAACMLVGMYTDAVVFGAGVGLYVISLLVLLSIGGDRWR